MDTIAALATPPGRGGLGVIRISGPGGGKLLRQLAPSWREDTPSHMLRLHRLRCPTDGALIDEALVVLMRGPHSYTGEDVVELHCHGGPVVLRRALDAALSLGARPARPGEFTERAFLNGRIDLTQAEAVADLIGAESEAAHRLAIEHLDGGLGRLIAALLEQLVEAMVLVESALDFSHEEHVYQIERNEIDRRMAVVERELCALRSRFDQGRRQREGVRVVVMGGVNAGKSTLFNALYGAQRAIVTDVEGTTRDFIEEALLVGEVAIRLVDTAGLRETNDQVEQLGIARSLEWGDRAELVLWVVDQSAPLSLQVREGLERLVAQGRRALVVLNKQDRAVGLSDEDAALLDRFTHRLGVALGAQPAQGVELLREALGSEARALTQAEGVLLSRARHFASVTASLQALERVREALALGAEHELLAIDLREALDALGDVVGRVSTEDLLNRIFSTFCVGK